MKERDHAPHGWRINPRLPSDKTINQWTLMNRAVPKSMGPLDKVCNPKTKAARKARITLAKVWDK